MSKGRGFTEAEKAASTKAQRLREKAFHCAIIRLRRGQWSAPVAVQHCRDKYREAHLIELFARGEQAEEFA